MPEPSTATGKVTRTSKGRLKFENMEPYGSADSGLFLSGGRYFGCLISIVLLVFPLVVLIYGLHALSLGVVHYEVEWLPLQTIKWIIAIAVLLFAPLLPFRLWLLFTSIEQDNFTTPEEQSLSTNEVELWQNVVTHSSSDRYLVMVALYKEAGIVRRLVNNLARLKYPDDQIDILLLVEEGEDQDIAEENQKISSPKSDKPSKPAFGLKAIVRSVNAVIQFIGALLIPARTARWLAGLVGLRLFGSATPSVKAKRSPTYPFKVTTYQAALAAIAELEPAKRQRFIVAKVPTTKFIPEIGKHEPQTKPRALNYGIYHQFDQAARYKPVDSLTDLDANTVDALIQDFRKSRKYMRVAHVITRWLYKYDQKETKVDEANEQHKKRIDELKKLRERAIESYKEHTSKLVTKVQFKHYVAIEQAYFRPLDLDDNSDLDERYETRTAVSFWNTIISDLEHFSSDRGITRAIAYDANEEDLRYCVVYDAEDRPEEDQLLKAVRTFYAAPAEEALELLQDAAKDLQDRLGARGSELRDRVDKLGEHMLHRLDVSEQEKRKILNKQLKILSKVKGAVDKVDDENLQSYIDELLELLRIWVKAEDRLRSIVQLHRDMKRAHCEEQQEQIRRKITRNTNAVRLRFGILLSSDHLTQETICLQCKLTYENLNDNWIISLFKADYASWFNYMLPGLHHKKLPIPLGGTSNHFLLEDLKNIGGWDAYNVAEDCDLGMWIARDGKRVRILNSITWEIANGDPYAWVKQRSRWIKGYAQSYFVHMRNPYRLWKQLRAGGFWSFQLTVGAGFLLPMLGLFFYVMTTLYALSLVILIVTGLLGPDTFNGLRPLLTYIFDIHFYWILPIGTGSFFISNAIYALILIIGQLRHPKPGQMRHVILWWALYWILMVFAGVRALSEYIVKPFHWELSDHNYVG